MMKVNKVHIAILLAGLLLGIGAQSRSHASEAKQERIQLVQSGGPGGSEGGEKRRGPPPPEAIAACKSKAAGATCNFTDREGEKLTGTCFVPPTKASGPTDLPMACRPDRGPKGGQGKG